MNVSVAAVESQMFTVCVNILKVVSVPLLIPAPPFVAPLGGNTVSDCAFVIPF